MKNNYKIYISLGVILSVMTLITIFAFRQEAQTNNLNQANQQDQDDLPTEVQDGVKTARQKEHGKRFNGYGSTKLQTLNDKGTGQITIELGIGLTMLEPNAPPFDRQRFLHDIACEADAVIIGGTRSKNSQMTEDENFIFTDYDTTVNQIFKQRPNIPISNGNNVIVTRIGGKIKYKGRVFTAIDKSFKPFKLNGQYLLYLKYIPETESFQAYANGSFYLKNNRVEQLGGESVAVIKNEDASQFVNYALDALAIPCNNVSQTRFRLQ